MLFTSAAFVLLFLPITLTGFYVFGRRSPDAAAAWLCAASFLFYGYWMPAFTLLLIASIGLNFFLGLRITTVRLHRPHAAWQWLMLGLVVNLLLLGYFKYFNFFVNNLEAATGTQWHLAEVLLPIGISFYTFTQIAYLVDAYQGKVGETRLVHYGLFVTYFPHLIAGPIIHHAQMMPQFARPDVYRWDAVRVTSGLVIFALGLVKKVVFADGISPYADAVFDSADHGLAPTTQEAWIAMVAYTLQLYFDFSGYSDMAVGLSWMFNIRLPFNFDSPYRSLSISEFWRRWHMSLSAFLRDYLYVPLGGNRRGSLRRYVNLATTMLLGGLWHGANWTFVFWGGLHGLYLMVNHAFRAALGPSLHRRLDRCVSFSVASWALTLLAVMVAWVFFRAQTFGGALLIVEGLWCGKRTGQSNALLWNAGLHLDSALVWCGALGLLALLPTNSNAIGLRAMQSLARRRGLIACTAGAALTCILMLVLVNATRDSVSAFIYFNF